MSTQDAERVLQRQLQKLALEEQSATSDYNCHLFNHDDDLAADAMEQVAQARNRREVLTNQYRAEQERNTYRAPYVSDEQRQARQPSEMDQQDLANIMNTSRYSGKSFTARDYDDLRRGLNFIQKHARDGIQMTIADNPEALAGFVRHLGGEIVEAPTFKFEIPLSETRRVIPEINKLGLRCERISERTGTDPNNGNAITVATIELRRQPEKSAYQEERDLMAMLIR